ncbi:MAG TPA: MFS transporter, partial [Xanthobacteraceae bacterium]|nr:MFS transporter [Xanthobacteraceae bacterium]
MSATVNAGARLDRLPISSFHHRIFWLIGAGMFFDGYDLYVGTTVLGATLQSGFSTIEKNAQFVSLTFLGMTLGALIAGFIGDRYGRRFTYQFNLMVFGIASFAATFAPNMDFLIIARFVIGLGLGAEIVVGYATLTEFVPPKHRGRWLSFMAMIVVSGLPVTVFLGTVIIPSVSAYGIALAKEQSGLLALLLPGLGWRLMFLIAGIGALVVWYMRKALPESPRWLEARGRAAEAEMLMQAIEQESAAGKSLPPPASTSAVPSWTLGSLFSPALLPRMVVGAVVLISVNTLIFGFVLWLPQFFVQQGLSITRSFSYTLVITSGSIVGCAVGAF